MNWTLISVIVVLAVYAIIGIKKGLLKMVFNLVFAVAAIALTVFLAPGITKYIKSETDWDEKMRAGTESYFEENGLLLESDSDEGIKVLPDVFQKEINNAAEEYILQGYEAYNNYIVDSVTNFIFSAAVMVGILLVLVIVFVIVNVIISAVGKLPVIKTVNRFAGMLVGLACGMVAVSFGFIVLMIFSNTGVAEAVYADVEANAFLSFIYNKNILLILVAKIF